MSQMRRGSVSIMWVIVSAVIALFAIVFGYMQAQERAGAVERAEKAEGELANTETKVNAEVDKWAGLSEKVGFTEQTGAVSSSEAITRAVEEAAGTAPSAQGAKTLQQALTGVLTDYGASASQRRSLEQQIEQLRNDLSARQREFAAALSEKDKTLSGLRTELEDTRNSSNTQVVDLERQRDALREQVREGEQQLSDLRTQMDEAVRAKDSENQQLGQRNSILSERLNAVERQASSTDGSVLTASTELGRAWIDRGRLDRVRPGMEFVVRNRRTGNEKGLLRVSVVEDRRAQVEILAQVDAYDPIGQDDPIYNDLYDPGRTPVAVLLGNGFGKLTNEEMKNMLTEVGIRVESSVTVESDYLIIGTPFFDPDTGELIPWENQDPYKAALSYSVQVVPFRDAMAWLGL